MTKKNWTYLSVITIVIAVSVLGVIKFKEVIDLSAEDHSRKISALIARINTYEEQEKRLACIQKTLEVSYPISVYEARYYSVIFDDFSKQYNIPWEIYPAIIRIESNFKPDLASKTGAKGLTQVLEGTGKLMATKLGIRYETNRTLWNEFLNVAIGFNYFSQGVLEKDSLKAGLKHAIRRYLGGPNYSILNQTSQVYVGEYQTTIEKEFIKLQYVYAGVVAENKGISTEKSLNLEQ